VWSESGRLLPPIILNGEILLRRYTRRNDTRSLAHRGLMSAERGKLPSFPSGPQILKLVSSRKKRQILFGKKN
jgi:hypothetical protein